MADGNMTENDTPLSELNNSELRAMVRKAGIAVPYYETRKRLDELIDEGPEPSGCLHGPWNLIDAHRWAIMEWAAAHWDEIYYQINCPLKDDEGCTSCPDFTVVNCLLNNRHVFDTGKEKNEMNLTIPGILVELSDGDKAKAASLMRELAKEHIAESPGTRLSLMKLTRAAFDVVSNGTMTAVTDYLGMAKKDMPGNVVNFATESAPQEVLNNLADILVAGKSGKKTAAAEAPAKKPAEKPEGKYFPGVSEAKDVSGKKAADDDDDDDDDDAPASSLPRPGQDASQFAKGKDVLKEPENKQGPPGPAEIAEMAKKQEPERPVAEAPAEDAPLVEVRLDEIRKIVRTELREFLSDLGVLLTMHYSPGTAREMIKAVQDIKKVDPPATSETTVARKRTTPDEAEKAATPPSRETAKKGGIPEMNDGDDDDD